jgi:eukaryotic-like serine/threonine-protein kinase
VGSLTVIGIGTTLNQRFLLEKELGRGGMGAVYSATDQLLERKVAIKVLKEQSGDDVGKKLRLEAQIAARLLHENVVRIYDFGQSDSAYFLVMEEVNGTSYSKRWRHLGLAERLNVLALVADALDYAHHQGVVHRDVKPANVLLTSTDVPKLSDFGLSISAFSNEAQKTGQIRGTPHYMSPEQTRGGRLDYRTDLYSLGVMIYESATGSVPFTGLSVSIMSQHYSAVPDRPQVRNSGVSNELETLILSLLAKRPTDRPPSGGGVAQTLRQEAQRARETAGPSPAGSASSAATIGLTNPSLTVPMPASTAPAANGSAATAPSVSAVDHTLTTHSVESFKTEAAPAVPPAAATPATRVVRVQATGSPQRTAVASVAGTGGMLALVRSPLVRRMLELVLAEPILLTAEERYLHGHYLAYLLSGSRRRGFFLRRPLEPRNADRARLLLGVTYAIMADATDEAIGEAAALLDQRIEVRTFLSPIVMSKYLSCRESPARRKLFRHTRKAIGEESAYSQKKMLDPQGVLNPGLMPQKLADLNLLAPAREEIDDVLVERWNRVAEVWRNQPEFRNAVLRYATVNAHRDPASTGLWPEVVYPLIERARWHRRIRGRTEAIWDYLSGKILHVADAGVVLDRAIERAVPARLVAELEESLKLMAENPRLDDDEADPFAPVPDEADRLTATLSGSRVSLAELAAEPAEPDKAKNVVRLADPNPLRFVQNQLHELWKDALQALQNQGQVRPAAKPASHPPVTIGPYRLVVTASIRGRAAGQIAIQGMANKQIELTTPSLRTRGSASKALLAIWLYRDNSLAIAHLDFMNSEHYVLWHAPRSHQLNFDGPADLNHELYTLGMEVPDQIDKVLSRSYKPRKPV